MKTVKEVSDLTGISVRTLHYYDQIGLLHPAQVTNSGYRLYGADQMRQLQLILFLKELRIPLKEIIQILNSPTFDPNIVLQQHRQLLILQRKQLNALIRYVDQMIKGECNMPFTAFDQTDINKTRKKYVDEVRTRWGNTSAYAQSEEKTKKYTDSDWENIKSEMEVIFSHFAAWARKKERPDCDEAQKLVAAWQRHITEHYYDCSTEMLAGLGQMYQQDPRFSENLEQYGKDCSEFASQAIHVYCQKK